LHHAILSATPGECQDLLSRSIHPKNSVFFFTEAKAKAINEPHKIESYATKEFNKAGKDPPPYGLHEAIPDAFTAERDVLNSAKTIISSQSQSQVATSCSAILFCDVLN